MLNLKSQVWSGSGFEMASTVSSYIILVICAFGAGIMLFYVFALRKVSLYKMKRKLFFNMIYDDFHMRDRWSLLFFAFFFIKRLIYGIDLAFLSDK